VLLDVLFYENVHSILKNFCVNAVKNALETFGVWSIRS